MGLIGSHNRKLLSSDQIDSESKPNLERIFNNYKSSEGVKFIKVSLFVVMS